MATQKKGRHEEKGREKGGILGGVTKFFKFTNPSSIGQTENRAKKFEEDRKVFMIYRDD
jgi:hypothetical protein